MFDGIRKCLDIPDQIGHIITKVRKVDLEREGDIVIFIINNFITFRNKFIIILLRNNFTKK